MMPTDYMATPLVMAGLDPAIQSAKWAANSRNGWMAGSSPAMTKRGAGR